MATKQENFNEYMGAIRRLHYKNVESALGNIYRAARQDLISRAHRDELIKYAKARYGTTAGLVKNFNDLSGTKARKVKRVPKLELKKEYVQFTTLHGTLLVKPSMVVGLEDISTLDAATIKTYVLLSSRSVGVKEMVDEVAKKLGWVK